MATTFFALTIVHDVILSLFNVTDAATFNVKGELQAERVITHLLKLLYTDGCNQIVCSEKNKGKVKYYIFVYQSWFSQASQCFVAAT